MLLILVLNFALFRISHPKPRPEAVVAKFFECLKKGDTQGARELTTERFGRRVSTASAFFDFIHYNPFERSDNPFTEPNLTGEALNETYRVWHRDMTWLVFVLVKVEGEWRIDAVNINFSIPGLSDWFGGRDE